MNTCRFIGVLVFFFQAGVIEAQQLDISPTAYGRVWDFKNSTKKFNIDTIEFSQIPGDIEYRGIIVEAMSWHDSTGSNILLLTATGEFVNHDPSKPDETQRAELYAYRYLKRKGEGSYKRVWKLFDYSNCFGVDLNVSFYNRSLTITDIDKDGISEITMIYQMFCGGGVDPGLKRLIMYEGNDKYAIRGMSLLCLELVDGTISQDGGEYKADKSLIAKKNFYEFTKKRWDICDRDYK